MTESVPAEWQGFPVFDKHHLPPRPAEPGTGGVVLMAKPEGISSFGMVRKLQRHLGLKKVGHAGTLDPAAGGLLIMCFGKATKVVDSIQAESKVYIGEVTLGKATASYDRETPVIEEKPCDHITENAVRLALEEAFTGMIEQIPPMYSALKVDGQPLYKKARKGEMIEVKPRQIQIYAAELLEFDLPVVKIRIHCSKGTYIRSIAYDLGRHLGTCGYLSALERTQIGSFDVERAIRPEQLEPNWP